MERQSISRHIQSRVFKHGSCTEHARMLVHKIGTLYGDPVANLQGAETCWDMWARFAKTNTIRCWALPISVKSYRHVKADSPLQGGCTWCRTYPHVACGIACSTKSLDCHRIWRTKSCKNNLEIPPSLGPNCCGGQPQDALYNLYVSVVAGVPLVNPIFRGQDQISLNPHIQNAMDSVHPSI